MRVLVQKTKTILACVMVLFFGGYGIFYIVRGPAIAAVAFLGISLLFGWLLVKYASILTVDAEGIRLTFLGVERRKMNWADIHEIGLIGENVFHHDKKKKNGDKYIYFSPVKMNADERFAMIVRWPPKDKLYVEYSEKALEYIMTFWQGELETYNVEDLYPNSSEPKGSQKK